MLPISETYPTRIPDAYDASAAAPAGLDLAQRARAASPRVPALQARAAAGAAGTARPDAGKHYHWFSEWLSQQHGLSAEQRRTFGADWIRQSLASGVSGQPLQPRALLQALLTRQGIDPGRLPALPAHLGRSTDLLNELADSAFQEAAVTWFMSEIRQRAGRTPPAGAAVNVEQILMSWINSPRGQQPMPGSARDDVQAMVDWLLTQTGTREHMAPLLAGPERAALRDAIGPGLYLTAVKRDFAVSWFVEHMRQEILAPDKNPFLSDD